VGDVRGTSAVFRVTAGDVRISCYLDRSSGEKRLLLEAEGPQGSVQGCLDGNHAMMLLGHLALLCGAAAWIEAPKEQP